MRLIRFLLTVVVTSLVWLLLLAEMVDEGYITINEVPVEQTTPAHAPAPKPAPKSKSKAKTKTQTPIPAQPQPTAEVVKLSLAEGIIGEWEPVEIADQSVVFSKYGTCKRGRHGMDYVYKVSGNKVSLYYDDHSNIVAETMTAVATRQGDVYYLEIYNNGDFGGKYRRK